MNEEAPKPALASKPAWLLALEIVTRTMVGSLFIVGLLIALQRCKSKTSIIIPWKKSSSDKDHMTIYIDSEMLKDVLRFSRQELEVACEDFSNIIGSSPDSLVYKGTMKGGPEIAVISLCIKEEHWTGYLELYYQREVPYITTALMDAKLGTKGRKDLFDWLSRQLSGLKLRI
ncbi:hypothetical protein CsSME_00019355 [Camellia sinensis var. sinensis]